MKKRMFLISLLLVVMLVMSACGTAGNTATTAAGTTAATTAAAESELATTEPVGPPAELTAAYITFGAEPKDAKFVSEEISKLTLEKINASVNLMPINAGQYDQQINLMLSSGESLDLMVQFFDKRASMISKGSIIAIDEIFEQYGQGIKEAIGEEALMAGKMSGKLYTIPTTGVTASEYSVIYNKDMADELGIDFSNVKTLEDLTPVLEQAKQKLPEGMSVLGPQMVGVSILGDANTVDYLNDYLGVLSNYGQDNLQLINYFETPEYAAALNLMRAWNQAGYTMVGSSTNKEPTDDLMKAKKIFARFGPDAPGEMENNTAKYGFTTDAAPIKAKLKGGLVVNQWAVTQNCKDPVAAIKFLNLLYTDKEAANLAAYGIEGTHYQRLPDGTLDYLPGIDSSTTGYVNSSSWMLVFQPITDSWKGSPEWSDKLDYYKSGLISKAYGFSFDPTNVKTEVTSITNVMNQYKLPLECGEIDPVEYLPKYIAKLKDAGLEKVIAEKQKQLDEWAAVNGIK